MPSIRGAVSTLSPVRVVLLSPSPVQVVLLSPSPVRVVLLSPSPVRVVLPSPSPVPVVMHSLSPGDLPQSTRNPPHAVSCPKRYPRTGCHVLYTPPPERGVLVSYPPYLPDAPQPPSRESPGRAGKDPDFHKTYLVANMQSSIMSDRWNMP